MTVLTKPFIRGLELPRYKMGFEYCAQADVCRFTSQNVLNERDKEVITFNPECGQVNATLGKKARRSRNDLPLSRSFWHNNQIFLNVATRNNQIIDLRYIVDPQDG